MNARRIHELMRAHFPVLDAAQRVWENVADEKGKLLVDRAEELIASQFAAREISEVLVEVDRRIGGKVPLVELVPYLAHHIGKADIRIADREFTTFVLLARSGVSSSWQVS